MLGYLCMYVFTKVYRKVRIKNIGTKILTKKLSMCECTVCIYLGKLMHIYGHLDSNIHVSIEMPNMEIM